MSIPNYIRVSKERIQFYQPQPPLSFFMTEGCNYAVDDTGLRAYRVHHIRKCRADCSCKQ
jgi:hypothetical protein